MSKEYIVGIRGARVHRRGQQNVVSCDVHGPCQTIQSQFFDDVDGYVNIQCHIQVARSNLQIWRFLC